MYLEIVVDGLFKFRLKDEPRHSGALDIEEQKKETLWQIAVSINPLGLYICGLQCLTIGMAAIRT